MANNQIELLDHQTALAEPKYRVSQNCCVKNYAFENSHIQQRQLYEVEEQSYDCC